MVVVSLPGLDAPEKSTPVRSLMGTTAYGLDKTEQMSPRRQLIRAEADGDVSAVLRAHRDPEPHTRALALGSLSRMDALTDELLQSALADEDRDVRVRAIELAFDRQHIDLLAGLADGDDLVVETTAWALGEREVPSAESISALVATASDHDVSICREAAVAALGAIGHEDGLPAILAALDDRAPVRRRAVLALAPFDTPEVTDALEKALTDRDRQVRQAAEDLL